VPGFSPFAGVRYDTGTARAELGALTAPPYDVVDEDQRAALEAADEHNAVRLILPRDIDREGDRYQHAAETFEQWCNAGILRVDSAPRFYAYRMTYADRHGAPRHTRGVIGALALPEPGAHDVLPHERTLPKAKSDRLALLRAMRVNVDPIWGLTLADGLTPLLEGVAPLARCHDTEGVLHELGAIDDPARIAAISELVASAPLVLADGHHRFETACTYRDEVKDGGGAAIMTLVVELVEDELYIEPIHRLVDLPADIDVRARLADAFDLRAVTLDVDDLERAMAGQHALGLLDPDGAALAVPREAVSPPDSAIVESLVVPRLPEASWTYRHDAEAVAALVDKGIARAAILCSPVSVAQTRAIAMAGERMPQKTTFFSPKPRTGMVFRVL